MLSAVLRSETAVKVSLQIMGAFVEMRRFLKDNAEVFLRMEHLERKQLKTDESIERQQCVSLTIYTQKISNQLALDVEKHNAQYSPVSIRKFKNAHDRFLIIDNAIVYHVGASLKDLGKKWFAFSKMNINAMGMLSKVICN